MPKSLYQVLHKDIILAEPAGAGPGSHEIDQNFTRFSAGMDIVQQGPRGQDQRQAFLAGGMAPPSFKIASSAGGWAMALMPRPLKTAVTASAPSLPMDGIRTVTRGSLRGTFSPAVVTMVALPLDKGCSGCPERMLRHIDFLMPDELSEG